MWTGRSVSAVTRWRSPSGSRPDGSSPSIRTETAIERSKARLAPWAERITFVHGNFRSLGKILDDLGIDRVNGMLFDLGVSSPQLDEAERGFSYMADAPLDMRMDQSAPVTAWTVVNTWPERGSCASCATTARSATPTALRETLSARGRRSPWKRRWNLSISSKAPCPARCCAKSSTAKRSFQAIRIAVNDELEAEREMLLTAMDRLAPGGRLCVISFHSLEDRIVKTAIREREDGCTCPCDFPVCVCGFVQTMKTVTKPITASEEELNDNPRARSARLRVAERI